MKADDVGCRCYRTWGKSLKVYECEMVKAAAYGMGLSALVFVGVIWGEALWWSRLHVGFRWDGVIGGVHAVMDEWRKTTSQASWGCRKKKRKDKKQQKKKWGVLYCIPVEGEQERRKEKP